MLQLQALHESFMMQAQKDATQVKDETKGGAGKSSSRRREREPEAQSIGQGRATRRKRTVETETLLSAGECTLASVT
jgi:hypothetical protein